MKISVSIARGAVVWVHGEQKNKTRKNFNALGKERAESVTKCLTIIAPEAKIELDLVFLSNRERNEWIELFMHLRKNLSASTSVINSQKISQQNSSKGMLVEASQHAQSQFKKETIQRHQGIFRQDTGAFYR